MIQCKNEEIKNDFLTLTTQRHLSSRNIEKGFGRNPLKRDKTDKNRLDIWSKECLRLSTILC